MRVFLSLVLVFQIIFVFGQKADKYKREDLKKIPSVPFYHDLFYWASHPKKRDFADKVPGEGLKNNQDSAAVDVFFIHPTIYDGKQNPEFPWYGDVNDTKLNKKVDRSTIKYQASVFNGSAKIYAPRYRQAHIYVFKTRDLIIKQRALDMAYEDVKNSFQYYLENFNNDRPIIIAAHSQGTLHAVRIIKEFFQDQELQDKLVAAYLVGMPLGSDIFENLQPCTTSGESGCWVSWNTYKRDYYPPNFDETHQNVLSTNPLNWKIDATYAPRSKHKGAVLKNFRKIRLNICDAVNERGLLWISKPEIPGKFLLRTKRYHVGDYNLFYVNIRENIADRTENYLLEL